MLFLPGACRAASPRPAPSRRPPLRRAAAPLGLLIAALAAPAPAAPDSQRFTTTGGQVVTVEPVAAMSCPRLAAKLAEIDRTGYRCGGPSSVRRADAPLLDYENRVSAALHSRCAPQGADAAGALSAADWSSRPAAETRLADMGASAALDGRACR